jgi:hypothetical protein
MEERIVTGRIAGLAIFDLPEFGTRARFMVEATGTCPVVCAIEGNIAREFIAHYCEGDLVAVRGMHEARPSTAAANTLGLADFAYAAWLVPRTPVSRREAPPGP